MTVLTAIAPPRRRAITIAAAAVCHSALTALASFGLPSLLTAWTTSGDEPALRTAYVVWGVLAGLFTPAVALALVRRPLLAPAGVLAGLVASAVAVLAMTLEPENAEYAAVICGPAVTLLVLHPRRSAPSRRGGAAWTRWR